MPCVYSETAFDSTVESMHIDNHVRSAAITMSRMAGAITQMSTETSDSGHDDNRTIDSWALLRAATRPQCWAFRYPNTLRHRAGLRRVGVWRGGVRPSMSVSAPFVWRCLSGSSVAPFPHSSHRTWRADFPHHALGQDITPSPTARRIQAVSDV